MLKEELQEGRLVDAGEIIATGEDTVARMQGLIEDLLKLSRLGRVVSNLQSVELRPLIEEVIRAHQAEVDEQHATVELTLDAASVPADRNRLAEILDNLLVNALKYACDGRKPRIEIGSRTADGEVRLFVRDNGPGIEPQQHENIFGLFQQLDTTRMAPASVWPSSAASWKSTTAGPGSSRTSAKVPRFGWPFRHMLVRQF